MEFFNFVFHNKCNVHDIMFSTKYKILCKSINDKTFSYITSKICDLNLDTGTWIAGGVARKLWFGEQWFSHDIDYFFSKPETFAAAKDAATIVVHKKDISDENLNKYLEDNTDPSSGSFRRKMISGIHITDNATSIQLRVQDSTKSIIGTTTNYTVGRLKLQFIERRWYSDIDSIWDDFDFTICNFATDGKYVIADEQALEHCEKKVIKMNKNTFRPVDIKRVLKYSAYGFGPDLNIIENLKEQYENNTILDNWNDEDEYR